MSAWRIKPCERRAGAQRSAVRWPRSERPSASRARRGRAAARTACACERPGAARNPAATRKARPAAPRRSPAVQHWPARRRRRGAGRALSQTAVRSPEQVATRHAPHDSRRVQPPGRRCRSAAAADDGPLVCEVAAGKGGESRGRQIDARAGGRVQRRARRSMGRNAIGGKKAAAPANQIRTATRAKRPRQSGAERDRHGQVSPMEQREGGARHRGERRPSPVQVVSGAKGSGRAGAAARPERRGNIRPKQVSRAARRSRERRSRSVERAQSRRRKHGLERPARTTAAGCGAA